MLRPTEPSFTSGAAGAAIGWKNWFRTSFFEWSAGASLTTLGVGKDTIGVDDDRVTMSFSLRPRVSVFQTAHDRIWVGSQLAWTASLLSSDVTTSSTRVWIHDVPIEVGYNRFFFDQRSGVVAYVGPRLGASFPASELSRAVGLRARTSLGVGAGVEIPLLRGLWLKGLFLSAGGQWIHAFHGSGGGVAGEELLGPISDPGPTPRGLGLLEHNMLFSGTGGANNLVGQAGVWLTIVDQLMLGTTFGVNTGISGSNWGGGCVNVGVQGEPCTNVPTSSSAATLAPITTFDISLSYTIAKLVWLGFGYQNTNRTIGEDGKRRSVFYSSNAELYLSSMLFLDALFGKVAR